VDDVYWKAALACFVLFSSFVRPSKERGRAVFVRSPSSIEYRYSLSPSSLSAFFPFFFEKKNCVRPVFCFTVRCLTTYALIFLRLVASRFAHCFRKQTSRALVLPYGYRIASYYITIRISFPQKRLTNLFIQTVTVRYMYSGNQDVAKYRAYGTVY